MQKNGVDCDVSAQPAATSNTGKKQDESGNCKRGGRGEGMEKKEARGPN